MKVKKIERHEQAGPWHRWHLQYDNGESRVIEMLSPHKGADTIKVGDTWDSHRYADQSPPARILDYAERLVSYFDMGDQVYPDGTPVSPMPRPHHCLSDWVISLARRLVNAGRQAARQKDNPDAVAKCHEISQRLGMALKASHIDAERLFQIGVESIERHERGEQALDKLKATLERLSLRQLQSPAQSSKQGESHTSGEALPQEVRGRRSSKHPAAKDR